MAAETLATYANDEAAAPTPSREARHAKARLHRRPLTQRLLADIGELSTERRAHLDAEMPDWNTPLTFEDVDHALSVDDAELNEALTTWYNRRVLHVTLLTLDQIRVLAQAS